MWNDLKNTELNKRVTENGNKCDGNKKEKILILQWIQDSVINPHGLYLSEEIILIQTNPPRGPEVWRRLLQSHTITARSE